MTREQFIAQSIIAIVAADSNRNNPQSNQSLIDYASQLAYDCADKLERTGIAKTHKMTHPSDWI